MPGIGISPFSFLFGPGIYQGNAPGTLEKAVLLTVCGMGSKIDTIIPGNQPSEMEAIVVDKRALLMIRVDPPREKETEWNEWYSSKHALDRLAIKGFQCVRRFVAIDGGPKYLALYDLTDVGVLNSERYLRLRNWEKSQPPDTFEAMTSKFPNFSRNLYEQIYPEAGDVQRRGEVVLIVGHDVPPDRAAEFSVRYNTEYAPALLRVPGILAARRFAAFKGGILQNGASRFEAEYLSVYDLESEKAGQGPELKKLAEFERYTERFRGMYRHL